MNKQRKVVITTTYNDLGVIVDTKAEELDSSAQQWIPVSERLPDNRVSVIICYREWQQYAKRYVYSIVIGWYARKNSVNENVFCEWDADCDYDEDDDEYYIKEGWYEFTTQGNSDLMNWFINAEVVAWMPLPTPYKGGDQDEATNNQTV